jgi:UDP-N-acetylmuramoyl-tripeptide--D-alanyl-D-alanine ligase
MSALWTIDDMAKAMRAEKSGVLPADVPGISIDTRSIARGEAFFAIQGDNRDGHDFVETALKAGAGVAVVARGKQSQFPTEASLLWSTTCWRLARLGARRAHTQQCQTCRHCFAADRHGGGAVAGAFADGRDHSAASYNNHWGVPLSRAVR